LEKFHNLPQEKQDILIDAALEAFGSNGYKKTSISDIAAAAGISKAMVFHYFRTKKDLYFYLFHYCWDLITSEINNQFDNSVTDFFERITLSTEIKVAVIKRHPATLSFLNSVYHENNEEVKDGIKAQMSRTDEFRNKIAMDGMDYSKFKDDVDVGIVMKMLVWMAEGFVNPSKPLQPADLDDICKDFYECMKLLRNNLYKEQYL
jgi:AcrR family transcriptional regulator